MTGSEGRYSSGWQRMSDRDLLDTYRSKWASQYAVIVEAKTRGLIPLECPECSRQTLIYRHDYICMECRGASLL